MTERTGWQRVARRVRVPLGFVFAGVFLAMAHPTWRTMGWSLVLVVPGLWLRGYASGYVRKNAELTMTGPYGYTRNPLYLGSMLIAFGFAVAGGRWSIGVVLAGLFLAIYLPVIRAEEAYLRGVFAGFDAYAARVPRLLPRLWGRGGGGVTGAGLTFTGGGPSGFGVSAGEFSRGLYLLHREYNALMGAGAIYGALAVRLWLRR